MTAEQRLLGWHPPTAPPPGLSPFFCRFTILQARSEAAIRRSSSTAKTSGRRVLSSVKGCLRMTGEARTPRLACPLQPSPRPGGGRAAHLTASGLWFTAREPNAPGCPQRCFFKKERRPPQVGSVCLEAQQKSPGNGLPPGLPASMSLF